MGTVVKLVADAYPFGCLGDVRNLADKELAELKSLADKAKKPLFELVEAAKADVDKAEEEVKLTAENLATYVKTHKRAQLNEEAVAAGVEDPEKLGNATDVAQAILAKQAA